MKILGYNYKVYMDETSDYLGAHGKCHCRRRILQIANNLTEEGTVTTILHEAMEAIKYHLQLSLGHDDLMALEAGLYQVLVDNGVDLSPLLDHVERPESIPKDQNQSLLIPCHNDPPEAA